MRNTYKLSAILFIALLVITAQGVEAQRTSPNSNQQNQHYNSGKNERYARGQDSRSSGQGNGHAYGHYKNKKGYAYGHNKGNNGRGDDLRVDPRGHGHGHQGFDRNRGYHFHGGNYYRYHRGTWARMSAPIGMRVEFMPYGTEVIYTPYGVVYRFGTVYFERAIRGGGFIVISTRNRRGW